MQENKLLIPVAIVIAGILVAGAVFYNNKGGSAEPATPGTPEEEIAVDSIRATDHVLGNPDADVVIVEYSDIDCPFCAQFHTTMHRIIDTYGTGGRVAWVYRHFPLPQLHPDAPRRAEATECVAELGGNTAFWNYLDILFAREESVDELGTIAAEVGVDQTAFEECLTSGRHQGVVEAQFNEAIAAGGNGTPHSIIIAPDGELFPIRGAQPFEVIQQVIETILATS